MFLLRLLNVAWVSVFSILLYIAIQDHNVLEIIIDSFAVLVNGLWLLPARGINKPFITINVTKTENKEW